MVFFRRGSLYISLLFVLLQFGCKQEHTPTLQRMGFYNNADGSPIVGLINGAQKTLDIEIYEMDDPAVITAIRGALKRGVKLRIVKEPKPVGGSCDVFADSVTPKQASNGIGSCSDQQQLVLDVQDSGGSYVPFNKTNLCPGGKGQCYEHGKLAIADKSVAMISTGNFNVSNLCDADAAPTVCNRDYSYLTNDPGIVGTLDKIVAKDLAGDSYDMAELLGGDVIGKLSVSPLSLQPLVDFIRSAKKSIQVENQYLNEPNINAALIEAANRGVQVSVTVASVCAFGEPSASETKKTTAIYSAFDAAGVSSSMFSKKNLVNGVNGYLHAKTIIVDGTDAWLGSVNGSTTAVSYNREFGIFFHSADDVAKLSSIMVADHTSSESWQDSLKCAEGI